MSKGDRISGSCGFNAAGVSGGGGSGASDADFSRLIERHLRDWEHRHGELAVQFARDTMSANPRVTEAVNKAVLELLNLDEKRQHLEFDAKVDGVVQAVPSTVHRQIKAFVAKLDDGRLESGSDKMG